MDKDMWLGLQAKTQASQDRIWAAVLTSNYI